MPAGTAAGIPSRFSLKNAQESARHDLEPVMMVMKPGDGHLSLKP
jgi:hypothetical protein